MATRATWDVVHDACTTKDKRRLVAAQHDPRHSKQWKERVRVRPAEAKGRPFLNLRPCPSRHARLRDVRASFDAAALHLHATHPISTKPSSRIRTLGRVHVRTSSCRGRRQKPWNGPTHARRRHGRTDVLSSRTWDGETRRFGRMEGRRGVLRALKLPSALRSASCALGTCVSRTVGRVGKRKRDAEDRRIRSVARQWRRKSDVVVQAVDRRTQLRGSEPRSRETRGDGTSTSAGSCRRWHVNRSFDVATSRIVVAHDVRCGNHTCERNVDRRDAFASWKSDVALGRANTRDSRYRLYCHQLRRTSRLELLVGEPNCKDRNAEAQTKHGSNAEPELELAVRHLHRETNRNRNVANTCQRTPAVRITTSGRTHVR